MSQPAQWKSHAPAWIALALTLLGWAYIAGVYVNQQDTNTEGIAELSTDVSSFKSEVAKEVAALKNNVTRVEGTANTNSDRLDDVELALNAIHQISTDVGVIKNDQSHIQSGINRMEGDIRELRTVAFGGKILTERVHVE